MNLMRMKTNMTPLNSLMIITFHFQDCCLISWFGKFKGFDNGNANPNMPILDDYVQVSNAPFMLYMPMQLMSSKEVFPPNSSNTPLIWNIILKLNAQQTIINTLDIQVDPFINHANIIVDDIMDITLKPNVCPHTIINASAPQVAHQSPSSPKATRPQNWHNVILILTLHQLASTYRV